MLFVLWLISFGFIQDSTDPSTKVIAIVDGYEISSNAVDRFLDHRLSGRTLKSAAQQIARQTAVEHLVKRRIVFQKISSGTTRVAEDRIRLEKTKFSDRLAEVGQTINDYLHKTKLTEAELDYEITWQIAWQAYLDKHLTDKNLKRFYQRNPRRFDGTKMQVAHLLLPTAENSQSFAAKIKKQIEQGETGWKDAVKQHSIATSSANAGGEIGWITYSGPMVAEFCEAAMQLEVGQISDPVDTKFGVHLIKCLKIEPGKIDAGDATEPLRKAATQFLFESLAEKNRDRSKIEIRSIE